MDLSRVPEPLRSRLEEQLSRLPPEVRGPLEQKLAKLPAEQLEAVLKKTSPMLERLAAKSGSQRATTAGKPPRRIGIGVASATGSTTGQTAAQSSRDMIDPHNHYNNTIRRGDRESPPLFVVLFIVASLVVFLRALGWLA
jgi:hypothetical protein